MRWICVVFMVGAWVVMAAPSRQDNGAYLAQIAGCVSCHTEANSEPLSGGKPIQSPYGVYYSSNLRSARFYDSAVWNTASFIRAVKRGVGPDHRPYSPVFPYVSFQGLTDSDVVDIWIYLSALSRVEKKIASHEPRGFARFDWTITLWQKMYLPVESERKAVSRGQYLADAVLHCTQCHTPRNKRGGLLDAGYLRGATLPNGGYAPNLTPHAQGLILWDAEDIALYLRSGKSTWGRSARGDMKLYVKEVSQFLDEEDLNAVSRYLHALSPQKSYPRCRIHGPRNRDCK